MDPTEFKALSTKFDVLTGEQRRALEFSLITGIDLAAAQELISTWSLPATFDKLWSNYPLNQPQPDEYPCRKNGKPAYDNQCCIKFGVTLHNSGVSLSSYTGMFCWHGHGRVHTLRVEEMKLWLRSAAGLPEISNQRPQKTYKDYLNRRGVVAFLNFWGQGDQGDHIDLWNGSELAGGLTDYFERSQEIWFWPIV